MMNSATDAAWLWTFLLKAFVRRVKRRIDMRIVTLTIKVGKVLLTLGLAVAGSIILLMMDSVFPPHSLTTAAGSTPQPDRSPRTQPCTWCKTSQDFSPSSAPKALSEPMSTKPQTPTASSLQKRAWFYRWIADPREYHPPLTLWAAQIEHMTAGATAKRRWRRTLGRLLPYQAEQLLIENTQAIAALSILVPIANQYAVGPQHIGPCLAEIRTQLLAEWCDWFEKFGTDPDSPRSGRDPIARQFSILLREGLQALRPQIKLANAVAVLVHELCSSTHFNPRQIVDDIIRWARTNQPVSSGEEAALRGLCRRIWNGHLPPAPITAGMISTVIRVCPTSGPRAPKKNLTARRRTCLNLLRWLQAQVTTWQDGMVDIPTDWFRQHEGERRGVSAANYRRLLMDPLIKLGVLTVQQQYSRARHQSTRYRLQLPAQRKDRDPVAVAEAERMLVSPDDLTLKTLDALKTRESSTATK